MSELAPDMLHRARGALVNADADMARKIPAEDDKVDVLYYQINQTIFAELNANPSTMDQTNLLIWVAHNLERMADRVTNICERAVYVASGEMNELDGSDQGQELNIE